MNGQTMNSPIPSAAVANSVALIAAWNDAAKNLKHYKELEAKLRADVVAAKSEVTDKMHKGTERIDIGQGFDLKILHKLNYKLNQDTVDSALDRIEKEVEHGELLATRLVRVTYELSVSEYEKLPDEARKIIDQVLTVTPATPSVEIVPASKRK